MAEISSSTTVMSPYLNSSVDNSTVKIHAELWKSLKIISIIVFCLAFVLGVVGNGFVIWVSGFKMKKTVNTVWYLNLAVADFLCTAFLPFHVTTYVMNRHWPFGHFMCKFYNFFKFLSMFASVYILVVISVDRCICVVLPVWAQNHRNVSRALLLSLGVWLFALLLSSPYFVFRDLTPTVRHNESVIACSNKVNIWYHAVFTRFVLGFVIPFIAIVFCNAIVIHRLKRNRSMSGRTRRPFKIIAAVITAFFLCWAPYHILRLIARTNSMSPRNNQTLKNVTKIAYSLTFFNSCLNPLLYVFIGQDFKDKVRKSVLKVLETAFNEEVSRTNTCTNSMLTSRCREQESKSFSEAEV